MSAARSATTATTRRPPRPSPLRFAGAAALLVAVGCGGEEPDAYGNFEAEEVTVSAETSGRLLRYDVREGERLADGAVVGLVDTVQAALELREVRARLAAARSNAGRSGSDAAALEAELAVTERDLARTERLHADDAATQQQLDAARSRVDVLRARLAGARSQTRGSDEQVEALEARVERLEDRLARSHVMNPVPGTVLASFVEAGEFVAEGRPLYDIAALDTLTLRAYVAGPQLSGIRLGQAVLVRYDDGAGVPGIVTWVASEAEFTPTPIQTREERTDLVYAVKIRVPNTGGRLKVGMPADVEFRAAEDDADGA